MASNVIEFTIKGRDAFSGVMNKTASSISRVAGTVAKAVGGISALTAAISPVLILNTARSFEKMEASLKTVTGSAQGAANAMGLIQNFATQTPFQISEITDAFIKLKSLGLDPSERALEAYGNTASAMGKSLNQFIEAVADASTNEFERLKEFGIKARQQADTVDFTFQGITTTVKKNADDINEFLIGIGENQFAGAMAEQMNTLDGRISNLKDNVDKLFVTLGKAGALDIAKKAVSELSEFVKNLGPTLIRASATAIVAFDNIKNAIQQSVAGGTVWEDFVRLAFSALKQVFDAFVSSFQAILPVVAGIFQVLWESFLTLGKWAFDRVKQVYVDGFPQVIAAIGGLFVLLWEGAVEGAKFAWDNIRAIFTGGELIGFDTLFQNIDQATAQTRKNIDDLLLSIDVDSPPLIDVIAKGIPEATAEARAKLTEDFDAMLMTMGTNLSSLKDSLVETFGISQEEVNALVETMLVSTQVTAEGVKENIAATTQQVSEFWQVLDKRVKDFNKKQGSVAQQLANGVFTITQKVIDNISRAAAKAIITGKSFSDSMNAIVRGIGEEIIAMLIRVGIQRAGTALLFGTAAVAEAKTGIASSVAQAGPAAYTSTAAIPVVGPALAPGAAATAKAATAGMGAAGIAAVIAAAAALGKATGQFHSGGVVPRDGTFNLQGGEFVVPRNPSQDVVDAINANFGAAQQPSTIVIEKIAVLENATAGDALLQIPSDEWQQIIQEKIIDGISELGEQGIASTRDERG